MIEHLRVRGTAWGLALSLAASTSGCSSNDSSANAPAHGALGATCSAPGDCTNGTCLTLVANDQHVTGLCSATCTGASDCGSRGECVTQTALGGGACFLGCSAASDCAPNVPCFFDPDADGGVCLPTPSSICDELGAQGPCATCLGASCCSQVKTCFDDLRCGQIDSTCTGDMVCAAFKQSSNAAAQGLAACAQSQCAASCQ